MRTEGRRSSRLLEWMVILAVPALLVLCAWLEITQAAVLTFFAAILAIIPFFFRFEGADPKPRDIMPPVVMAALATAGQLVFAPVASFKPVGAVIIVTAIAFGRQTGFVTGALTALSSNMFFGQGPWTPWQMFAWGLIGYLAGTFSERGWFRHRFFVYLYGFLSGLIFGLIMDSWHIIGFIQPLTWKNALAAYGAGLPMNLTLSVATLLFLLPILEPWSRKLTRIKRKFDLSDGQQSR
ncbi:MAG TPA: ECF transporter S component [Bacillota bacterium]|jgi:energy-coupling factor transport system substrate-specific component|nr:ECF transporter S component [Fastidiosipila sp.]HPX92847.1 ECF transporter S component [Bacillota bacterium]HQB81332.1 ECF transporter S component [Bacillota bacterium]